MNDIQRLYAMARSLTMTARVSDDCHRELTLSSGILWNAMTHAERMGALNYMHKCDVYSAPLSVAYPEST